MFKKTYHVSYEIKFKSGMKVSDDTVVSGKRIKGAKEVEGLRQAILVNAGQDRKKEVDGVTILNITEL